MKFGKRLQSHLEETIPEWRDKFLCYKQLKKRLKLLPPAQNPVNDGGNGNVPVFDDSGLSRNSLADNLCHGISTPDTHEVDGTALSSVEAPGRRCLSNAPANHLNRASAADDADPCPEIIGAKDMNRLNSEDEVDFVHLLNTELEKFNTFFIEKEEEYVIRLQELKERIENWKVRGSQCDLPHSQNVNEEEINIRKDVVKIHGEMVLLENYSSLNYTGLVKILKKHDKQTGALLRMPYIQNVLQQPFFTTELLSKLVRECENDLLSLFPSSHAIAQTGESRLTDSLASQPQRFHDKTPSSDVSCTLLSDKEVRIVEAQGPSREEDVERIYRSIMDALRTLKDLRRGSSTYSIFSLPPFGQIENELQSSPTPICATMSIN